VEVLKKDKAFFKGKNEKLLLQLINFETLQREKAALEIDN
jgi:hypothetical protein